LDTPPPLETGFLGVEYRQEGDIGPRHVPLKISEVSPVAYDLSMLLA
jgi:hypothetical protein